jgi:hypothetical protein
VPNYDRGDGCTINDLIEDDRDWPSKGRFLQHVRAVTNELRDDGVITRQEQNAILAAAGAFDIG